jgi:hypothetical protein
MKKTIEIIFFWLLPILGFYIIILSWQNTPLYSLNYLIFKLLFPILLMTVVVSTGAGYLKLWSFHTRYTVNNVLPQISIIYSTVLNLSDFYTFQFIGSPILYIILISIFLGFAGTIFDIPVVHYELLKVKTSRKKQFKNAVEKVLIYGPYFFSMVGLINGLGLLAGYQLVEGQNYNPFAVALLMAVACFIPFFIYFKLQVPKRKLI